MNILLKSDLVFSLIEEIVLICSGLEVSKKYIDKHYDTYNQLALKPLLECAEKCKNCKINKQDVFNEYWNICRDVDDLQIVASLISTRYKRIIPPAERIHADNFISNVFKSFENLERWGYISKNKYNEILESFCEVHDFLNDWDCDIYGIIEEMNAGKHYQSQPNEETKELTLPDELNTDRARKYFTKAIEAGYIKITENGLQWVFIIGRGNKVSLGYFIQKVFCPNNTESISEKDVNKLFGVDRIGSAITQMNNAKKPQKWKTAIDKLFE